VDTNNHVRLWLDHALLIDQWARCSNTSFARVNLTATTYHFLVLEYRDLKEAANIHLMWSSVHTRLQVCCHVVVVVLSDYYSRSNLFLLGIRQVIPQWNLFRQREVSRSPTAVQILSDVTDAASSLCEGSGLVEVSR